MDIYGMKPLFKFGSLAAGLVVGALGCDWRKLDDAVANAPVVAFETPSGYPAADLGRLIVPLPHDPSTPKVIGRFVFFGLTRPSIGLAEFDAAGKVKTYAASEAVLTPMTDTVTSAVFVGGQGRAELLLGVSSFGGGDDPGATFRLTITYSNDGPPTFALTLDQTGIPPGLPANPAGVSASLSKPDQFWGSGIALGDLNGDMAADTIVSSRDRVFVTSSPPVSTDADKCSTALTPLGIADARVRLPRPIATADLVPGGTSEIYVGLPRPPGNMKGVVRLLRRVRNANFKSMINTPGIPEIILDCPVDFEAPEGTAAETAAGFGTSLAPLDLDGDGKDEALLVGAPPALAFVIKAPTVNIDSDMNYAVGLKEFPAVTIAPPAPALGFGLRVAAFDYDGKPGDEIIVSAPDAPDGTKAQTGQVFIFKLEPGATTPTLLSFVKDNQSEALSMLGYDVAGMPFVAPACAKTGAPERRGTLLVAGNNTSIFTYFRTPVAPGATEIPDPRCQ